MAAHRIHTWPYSSEAFLYGLPGIIEPHQLHLYVRHKPNSYRPLIPKWLTMAHTSHLIFS